MNKWSQIIRVHARTAAAIAATLWLTACVSTVNHERAQDNGTEAPKATADIDDSEERTLIARRYFTELVVSEGLRLDDIAAELERTGACLLVPWRRTTRIMNAAGVKDYDEMLGIVVEGSGAPSVVSFGTQAELQMWGADLQELAIEVDGAAGGQGRNRFNRRAQEIAERVLSPIESALRRNGNQLIVLWDASQISRLPWDRLVPRRGNVLWRHRVRYIGSLAQILQGIRRARAPWTQIVLAGSRDSSEGSQAWEAGANAIRSWAKRSRVPLIEFWNDTEGAIDVAETPLVVVGGECSELIRFTEIQAALNRAHEAILCPSGPDYGALLGDRMYRTVAAAVHGFGVEQVVTTNTLTPPGLVASRLIEILDMAWAESHSLRDCMIKIDDHQSSSKTSAAPDVRLICIGP